MYVSDVKTIFCVQQKNEEEMNKNECVWLDFVHSVCILISFLDI
jgi:hypothetical protein